MTTCRSDRPDRCARPMTLRRCPAVSTSTIQRSTIPADRESRSPRGILRRPHRGIPIYQTAGANTHDYLPF